MVLAKGAGPADQALPVVAYQPVGSGRVVVVEGAGMWRWAFLAPEHQKQEEIYGSLWRSLVHWLVANVGLLPSQRMSLRADKLTFTADENVTATLLVRDWSGEPPQVRLVGPEDCPEFSPERKGDCPRRGPPRDGERQTPHLYLRTARRLSGPVLCRLGPVARGAIFAQRPGGRQERTVGRGRLRRARKPGRTSGPPRGAGRDEADCPVQRRRRAGLVRAATAGPAFRPAPEPLPARTHGETTAWDRWWVLLGALTLWGAAWGLRRNWGLV